MAANDTTMQGITLIAGKQLYSCNSIDAHVVQQGHILVKQRTLARAQHQSVTRLATPLHTMHKSDGLGHTFKCGRIRCKGLSPAV